MVAAELAGRHDLAESPVELASASIERVKQPFAKQVEFFRNKLNMTTQAWTDIWHEEHDAAFVVAGAAQADLVEDLRQAVDSAVAEGTTLRKFREAFDGIVERHGWVYKGGRNWRTRVIYDTNVRSSYAAGRYRQMQDMAEQRPFWRYRHSHASENPRKQHQAWDGMILRHDDPWWRTNYPINGWGCKCYVEALNARDLERLGKSGPDKAPALNMRTVTVGKTGPSPRTVEVPEGIDPGFAYAPGATNRPNELQEIVQAKFAHDPVAYVAQGRKIREELVQSSGGTGAVGFEDRFRDALIARLQKERGAGKAVSGIFPVKTKSGKAQAGTPGAVKVVKGVSKWLPESWVAAGNKVPLVAYRRKPRAFYAQSNIKGTYGIALNENPPWQWSDASVALHEYGHHMQQAMPDLDALFHRVHRKRTAGEERVDVSPGHDEWGRKDKYLEDYYGREYYDDQVPKEVFTMTLEDTFFPRGPITDHLRSLAGHGGRDTELLDLLLGVLFHYDP